jgi:hypothetical protein
VAHPLNHLMVEIVHAHAGRVFVGAHASMVDND